MSLKCKAPAIWVEEFLSPLEGLSLGHAWVLPLLSLLDAALLGFAEVMTSGLTQRLLILPWELLGHGTRPANLSIWALGRHYCSAGTSTPVRLSANSYPLPSSSASQCWGLVVLCRVIGILVRELNPPCVVCSGRYFHFKLWFFRTLQLHNWELLGLLLFNVRVESKGMVDVLVLFSELFSCCLKGRVFMGSSWNQEKLN